MFGEPAEFMRLKNARLVKLYMNEHNCSEETLFLCAYRAYFGIFDYHEVHANLDRYAITEDPPPYVRAYLTAPRN